MIESSTGMPVASRRTKSPYDLKVGRIRIDVKSAKWSEYSKPNGHEVRGFIFAGCKYGRDCDMFFFVCLHPSKNRVRHVFAVPSSEANVQTVTISKRRMAAWSKWRDDAAYETIMALS